MVSYVSAQTSTSGVLMEDVMHLTTEDKSPERVEAYVTFGLVAASLSSCVCVFSFTEEKCGMCVQMWTGSERFFS